jgi:hypothetical protein
VCLRPRPVNLRRARRPVLSRQGRSTSFILARGGRQRDRGREGAATGPACGIR